MEFITSVERIGIRKGREAGRIEGKQEGHKQGLTDGETTVISRLLVKKFVNLPDKYLIQLKSADEEKLLHWADKILFAESLDEVFT